MISENPVEADRFLNETSKVYRYLLDNNKHELVALKTELAFIRSFFGLLQLRYGKGIALDLPPDGCPEENHLLPPLTLQLLVENAVKHNIHSKDKPLRIEILVTRNGQLVVQNNLQCKAQKTCLRILGLKTSRPNTGCCNNRR